MSARQSTRAPSYRAAGGSFFGQAKPQRSAVMASPLSEVQINCEQFNRGPGTQWPDASLATEAVALGLALPPAGGSYECSCSLPVSPSDPLLSKQGVRSSSLLGSIL